MDDITLYITVLSVIFFILSALFKAVKKMFGQYVEEGKAKEVVEGTIEDVDRWLDKVENVWREEVSEEPSVSEEKATTAIPLPTRREEDRSQSVRRALKEDDFTSSKRYGHRSSSQQYLEEQGSSLSLIQRAFLFGEVVGKPRSLKAYE